MAVASLGVIGTGVGTGGSTIDIPVMVDVPRSDPTLGASVVIVNVIQIDPESALSASDDAPTDSFYSTHLYTAGTNPWYQVGGTFMGLILNPLTASSDTITITFSGSPVTYSFCIAVAYTGVQVNNQPYPAYQVADLPANVWFDEGHIPGPRGLVGSNPIGGPSAYGVSWEWTQGGSTPFGVVLTEPYPIGYPNWSIEQGSIGLYFVSSSPFCTVDPGDFTPADGTWTEIGSQINMPTGLVGPSTPPSYSLCVFEKPLSPIEFNDDLDGTWSTADTNLAALGFGYMMLEGLGPIWLDIPPPEAIPVFNHRFRALD